MTRPRADEPWDDTAYINPQPDFTLGSASARQPFYEWNEAEIEEYLIEMDEREERRIPPGFRVADGG